MQFYYIPSNIEEMRKISLSFLCPNPLYSDGLWDCCETLLWYYTIYSSYRWCLITLHRWIQFLFNIQGGANKTGHFSNGHSSKTTWPIRTFDPTIKSLGNDLYAHKNLWTMEDMYSELAAHMFNKADSECARTISWILDYGLLNLTLVHL